MAGRDPTVTLPHGQPAWSRVAAIGDYDGALDKTNSNTETVPYAWSWYQDYTSMIGSAFTTDRASLVHAKKLTLARNEAAKSRAVERAIANSRPGTSDELLGSWAKVLGVQVYPEDERWEVRLRCDARLSAPFGPNPQQVDDSLEKLLGTTYVRTYRSRGTSLADPPSQTFWSENMQFPAASLGGGTWMSERARVVVQVRRPPDAELGAFLRTVNVALFRHLDTILPATCTVSWTAWDTEPGFYLDESEMDLVGFD
jgi:hypothetical protein